MQVLLQQSQEACQVLEFLEMFLTHDPTQPTKYLKILTIPNPAPPNPTKSVGRRNPWTTLIQLGTLCSQSLFQFVHINDAYFVHILFQYSPHAVINRFKSCTILVATVDVE